MGFAMTVEHKTSEQQAMEASLHEKCEHGKRLGEPCCLCDAGDHDWDTDGETIVCLNCDEAKKS